MRPSSLDYRPVFRSVPINALVFLYVRMVGKAETGLFVVAARAPLYSMGSR